MSDQCVDVFEGDDICLGLGTFGSVQLAAGVAMVGCSGVEDILQNRYRD